MKKILLIEDDPLLTDIYATKLRESGFETEVVERSEKALEVMRETKPDLVLLDIVLPRLDGWDILRQVQEEKDLRGTPIVILSNLGQKEEVEKGLALGAVKYLIKAHYTPGEVLEELKKIMGVV